MGEVDVTEVTLSPSSRGAKPPKLKTDMQPTRQSDLVRTIITIIQVLISNRHTTKLVNNIRCLNRGVQ